MAGPDETRAIAHSWVEAYNGKDYDRMGELLAPDMILEDVGMGLVLEGGQTFVDGIKEVAETAAPDRRLTFNTVYADGETLICEGSWSGTFLVEKWGNPPGTKHTHRSCTVLKTRDGQIIRFTDYTCADTSEPAAAASEER